MLIFPKSMRFLPRNIRNIMGCAAFGVVDSVARQLVVGRMARQVETKCL